MFKICITRNVLMLMELNKISVFNFNLEYLN